MGSWVLRLGIVLCMACSLVPQYAFADEKSSFEKYDWTGVYLGGHLGHVLVKDTLLGDVQGIAGGVLASYLHQVDDIVVGVEADLYWGDLMKKGSINGLQGSKKVNWGSTVRFKAGYAIDDWLIFASGGFATADVTIKGSNFFLSAKDTKTHYGYVLSGGVEKAIANNWHIRGEYTYGNFDSRKYTLGPIRKKVKGANGHNFRVAITYRFQPG